MHCEDLELYASHCRYSGRPDEALAVEVNIDEFESLIKSREIEVGIADIRDDCNIMERELERMKANALAELTPYEYFTSSIPTIEERNEYYDSFGLVVCTIFSTTDVVKLNNLDKRFNQDEHVPVLEGIVPFMFSNQVLDGMDVVHFVFEMCTTCTIAYNKEKTIWYLLIEGDVVFESNKLQDIFEYKNIVG